MLQDSWIATIYNRIANVWILFFLARIVWVNIIFCPMISKHITPFFNHYSVSNKVGNANKASKPVNARAFREQLMKEEEQSTDSIAWSIV